MLAKRSNCSWTASRPLYNEKEDDSLKMVMVPTFMCAVIIYMLFFLNNKQVEDDDSAKTLPGNHSLRWIFIP